MFEQRLGIAVRGLAKQRLARGRLDDPAGIHHRDAVAEFGNDPEIVSDEEDGHAEFAPQAVEQVEDLRLDGHVEGGRRLVGNEKLRVAGKRDRDHHALALSARHLVRVAVERLCGRGDADEIEELDRPRPCRGAAHRAVQEDGLGDLVADREDWVERGHRLLEDHADAVAPDRTQGRCPLLEKVIALERRYARP